MSTCSAVPDVYYSCSCAPATASVLASPHVSASVSASAAVCIITCLGLLLRSSDRQRSDRQQPPILIHTRCGDGPCTSSFLHLAVILHPFCCPCPLINNSALPGHAFRCPYCVAQMLVVWAHSPRIPRPVNAWVCLQFGEIEEVILFRACKTGGSKGSGFITMMVSAPWLSFQHSY